MSGEFADALRVACEMATQGHNPSIRTEGNKRLRSLLLYNTPRLLEALAALRFCVEAGDDEEQEAWKRASDALMALDFRVTS